MKEFKTRIVPRFVLQVSEKAWRQCLAELEIVNWTELTFVYPKHQLLLKQMKPNFPLQFKFFSTHTFSARSPMSPPYCALGSVDCFILEFLSIEVLCEPPMFWSNSRWCYCPFTKQHNAYAWVVTCILFLINLTFHKLSLHSSYKNSPTIHRIFFTTTILTAAWKTSLSLSGQPSSSVYFCYCSHFLLSLTISFLWDFVSVVCQAALTGHGLGRIWYIKDNIVSYERFHKKSGALQVIPKPGIS